MPSARLPFTIPFAIPFTIPFATRLATRLAKAPLATALLATALLASPPAFADTTAFPAVIRAMEQRGLEVFERREAPGGMTAYSGQLGRNPYTVFVTPDGKHALSGPLRSENGEPLAIDSLPVLPGLLPTGSYWSHVESTHWVADGAATAPRIIYVFTDPNCGYCDRFWKASRPWVKAGKVQLRHVMVGLVGRDARNKAAAILAAPSPSDTLTTHSENWQRGGVMGLNPIPEAARDQLDENLATMRKLAFRGTPGIVFRDDKGRVRRYPGYPTGIDLSDVMGPR